MIKAKPTCTRKIHFSSGHRIMNHEGNCATAHGHNYCLHVTLEADHLDSIGRILDFNVIKNRIGGWIEKHWDHTFLVWEKDLETLKALQMMPGNKDPFICPFNPTVENMALYLFEEICPLLLSECHIGVIRVILFETENCYAEVTKKGEL